MVPRSSELGMSYDVPILVASSFDRARGTLIHGRTGMDSKVGEIRNRVRGIATDENVAKITVRGLIDRPGISASLFEPLATADISIDVIVQNSSVDGTTDVTFTVERTDLRRALEVVEPVAVGLGSPRVVSAVDLAKGAAKAIDGGGGGRPDVAQAGGRSADKLDDALRLVPELVRQSSKPS